jgi:hypothetical protein
MMNRFALFCGALLLASSARAEFRQIDLTIFGMD